MAYKITFSPRFQKHYKKLNQNEKKQLKNKLAIFAENPLHPSLQGTNGLFECSVNMDLRIIWCYENDIIIIFLDIGHHDILNQY